MKSMTIWVIETRTLHHSHVWQIPFVSQSYYILLFSIVMKWNEIDFKVKEVKRLVWLEVHQDDVKKG